MDAADAEAICQAVRRPTMRLVEIKSEDQQAVLAIHRVRDLVVRQRTQVANMIRSILSEFGHILPTGIEAMSKFAREREAEDRFGHARDRGPHSWRDVRIDGLTKQFGPVAV